MAGKRRRFTILCGAALVASAALVRALVLPVAVESSVTTARATLAPSTQPTQNLPRAESTDPKQLKTLIPETLGALKQSDAEAGVRSIGEMRSTYAQGSFTLEGKPEAGHATVKIVDYIAMPGLIESVAPWQTLDIENETDAEYSRTISLGAHKAMETYVKQTRTGSINVLVAGRYVVTIEVVGMPPETLSETAKAMKLDDLAKLAK